MKLPGIFVSKSFNHSWLLVLFMAPLASAEVSRVEVASRQAIANGQEFGDVGAYEEIVGRVFFEIDPTNEQNRIIDGLELAPRNKQGKVEFSADLIVLAPVEPARGNDVVIVDIANRGRKSLLRLSGATVENPYGDGFLMREGFTMAWVGWEFDVPDRPDAVRIDVPTTTDSAALPVGGLGFAAVRDVTSWLRHTNELTTAPGNAMAFGISQSGRFLRSLLYLGFNTDESGRRVFDGLIAHIAGASRLDLNRLGAEPISLGMFTATAYPFADKAIPDPLSDNREGILENRRNAGDPPRIFYTNSSVEYWGGGRVAALVHSTPDGKADIDLPANVRSYLFAGTQHVPAAFPPENTRGLAMLPNPVNYGFAMRALFRAMDEWITDDVQPPPSVVPSRSGATLVLAKDVRFPQIPGVPSVKRLDAGVRSSNQLLKDGAGEGAALPLWVSQVDEDGNEVAGIRLPEVAVPLGTYTGWNFPAEDQRGLVPLTGSYIPFARSRDERLQNDDPRLSVEERYASKADYLSRVKEEAEKLIERRFLLQGDLDAVLERARRHWDLLVSPLQ